MPRNSFKLLAIGLLALFICTGAFAQKGKKSAEGSPKAKEEPRMKSPNGLEYRLVVDKGDRKGQIGDIAVLHVTYRNFKDSVLGTSRVNADPQSFRIQPPQFKGGLEEGLTLVGAGDSAIFWVSVDSLYKNAPPGSQPAFLPAGSYLSVGVKIFKMIEPNKIEQEEQTQLDYLAKTKEWKPVKMPSGLSVVILEEGKGQTPAPGAQVKVHYTGKLLNGEVFDSSIPRGEPFSFQLGKGAVIKGWDEGIGLLKEGTKAVLLIPSRMGYGEMGSPPKIPGFSPLVFEVELVKVEGPTKEKMDMAPSGEAKPAAPTTESKPVTPRKKVPAKK